MLQLILVRHGETDYNREGRFQGHLDIPLNELGLQQAELVAAVLRDEPFDAVYSSDLIRAYETAQVIARARKDGLPIHKEPRLREIYLGELQGKTHDEVRDIIPGDVADWRFHPDSNVPGKESLEQMAERIGAFLDDLRAAHQDQRVLIVAHGGSVGIVLALLLSIPIHLNWQLISSNCSTSEVHITAHGARLRKFNDTHHLK